MSITPVQEGGTVVDNSAIATRAFSSNVTAGNLIVVVGNAFYDASDPFTAGDCTKSAGTATIGTINFVSSASAELAYDAGTNRIGLGIWWALVTGSGSLTMQISHRPGSYWTIATGEYSATNGWDSSALEGAIVATQANDDISPASSGNQTSAGGALFIGGLAVIGVGVITTTPDAAFTQIFEEEGAGSHEAGSVIRRIVSSGTTDAAEWSLSPNDGWIAGLAVFKEAASGASTATATPSAGALTSVGRAPLVNDFSTITLRGTMINEAGSPLANLTDIRCLVWYNSAPVGAPDESLSSLTTNANGSYSFALALGGLAFGDPVYRVIYQGDPPTRNHAGRRVPDYE